MTEILDQKHPLPTTTNNTTYTENLTTSAGQEVPDVSLQFHDHDARARGSGEPGPVSTRNSRSSHTPVEKG